MTNLNELAKRESSAVARVQGSPVVPAVDVFESTNEIVLLADMPGVTKETLSVSLEDDILLVEGHTVIRFPETAVPILAEQSSTRYARNFTLSHELDKSRIEAEMKNGVLRLRIPKSEGYKPRKIEVTTGG